MRIRGLRGLLSALALGIALLLPTTVSAWSPCRGGGPAGFGNYWGTARPYWGNPGPYWSPPRYDSGFRNMPRQRGPRRHFDRSPYRGRSHGWHGRSYRDGREFNPYGGRRR